VDADPDSRREPLGLPVIGQSPLDGDRTLSGWELQALFFQPTLSTDSYAHPTISTLTEAGLASHFGRSLALLVWLALGWFLLER
jgi:hypothetical protein